MTGSGWRRAAMAAVLAWSVACTRLLPEQQLVQDAAAALGGAERIQSAGLLTMKGTGTQFNLGQDLRPGLADQTFTVSAFARDLDAAGPRMRTTLTRTPNFAYFQGPQPQTQVQGVDGEVAYNVGASGAPSRTAATVAADRRMEQLHHPLRLLRIALAADAKLSAVRTEGRDRLVDVTTDAGPVTLAVGADGRPTRISSGGSHINLGDVVLTTTFSDYADAGDGLVLPTRFATKVDAFTTGTYVVTNQVAAGTIEAPPEVRSAAAPSSPAPNVTTEEVAPGVWFLAGQSHHSVVVAFADRLVLVEAPQSEARSLAVIAKARELRPATPLTHLVMSHHHFDHSTGLRAAIAEGLTIVTHEGNEAFVKEMAGRRFTRQPDALEKASKALTVQPVGASYTLTDGTRTMALHHVAGNPHSHTMLMAHLPKERLLIEVDAFSPGGDYHPYAAHLLETIERLKLGVDRIVPLHGAIVTMKDLMAAARPTM